MQPIGPLMIEHRLIERMLHLMQEEFARIKANIDVDPEFAFVDPIFIDTAVDFIRTYADRCHHGKEENLLFKALAAKDLSPDHRQVVEELIKDHAWARETTANLVKAKEGYLLESPGALDDLMAHMEKLVEFYPRHIEKEDKHFFIPCMAYFSDAEKADLLAQMSEFDRQLIHEKYRGVVEGIEQHRGCKTCH
ncbi:MAG: hemerythrin domain-containing protein [Deltaproteobacteria bacterium]|jgi:hemerythrin-like domain-containing protein